MKKEYMIPQVLVTQTYPAQMLALSILDADADPNEVILVKGNEWDIFDESEIAEEE